MGAGRAGRGRQVQDAPPACGQLLQRYRVLAGLTQEELLDAYGLLDYQRQDHAAAHAKFAQALVILERLGADKDVDRLPSRVPRRPGGES